MGDLSFGKQFGMLKGEKQHFAVNTLRQGMLGLGLFTPTPWLFIILITTPGLMRGWNRMIDWSIAEVTRRINVCLAYYLYSPQAKFDNIDTDTVTERAKRTRCKSVSVGGARFEIADIFFRSLPGSLMPLKRTAHLIKTDFGWTGIHYWQS